MSWQRVLIALRGGLYATGFVSIWTWLALLARRFDDQLPVSIAESLLPVGLVLGSMGGLLTAWCVVAFITRGRGTPAPFDPPLKFVADGAYRWVRNPMYIGGFLVLLAAGLILASTGIVLLAAVFWLCAHLFVVLYEEPALETRFGADYLNYKASVNRWIPAPVTGA